MFKNKKKEYLRQAVKKTMGSKGGSGKCKGKGGAQITVGYTRTPVDLEKEKEKRREAIYKLFV